MAGRAPARQRQLARSAYTQLSAVLRRHSVDAAPHAKDRVRNRDVNRGMRLLAGVRRSIPRLPNHRRRRQVRGTVSPSLGRRAGVAVVRRGG